MKVAVRSDTYWLGRVPGVNIRGMTYTLPDNCVPLVAGLTYTPASDLWVEGDPSFIAWDAFSITPEYLKPYQQPHAEVALRLPNTLAYHATGSGKTLTMMLAGLTRAITSGKPLVIVTIASTKWHWYQQVRRYTNAEKEDIHVLASKTPSDLEFAKHTVNPQILIINWHILQYWRHELCKLRAVFIFDETDMARNPKRHKSSQTPSGKRIRVLDPNSLNAAGHICSASASARIGGTATLVPTTNMNAWGQLDLLEPGDWGTSHQFGIHYCGGFPKEYGGFDMSGRTNMGELQLRIRTMSTRVKKEAVLKSFGTYQQEVVFLGRDQLNRPGAFSALLKAARRDGPTSNSHVQLLQSAASKRAPIIKIIAREFEQGLTKHVVGTGRIIEIERLVAALGKAIPQATIIFGDGSTPNRERINQCARFKHEDNLILVCGINSYGRGLDGLQYAQRAHTAYLPYEPGVIEQWCGRFDRLAEWDVLTRMSFYIAEGTIDERVMALVLSHLDATLGVSESDEMRTLMRQLNKLDDPKALAKAILGSLL